MLSLLMYGGVYKFAMKFKMARSILMKLSLVIYVEPIVRVLADWIVTKSMALLMYHRPPPLHDVFIADNVYILIRRS